MNTKKFNKRLFLNKKTIADLNGKEMSDVYGGIGPTWYPNTCGPGSCIIGPSNCNTDNGRYCPCPLYEP